MALNVMSEAHLITQQGMRQKHPYGERDRHLVIRRCRLPDEPQCGLRSAGMLCDT